MASVRSSPEFSGTENETVGFSFDPFCVSSSPSLPLMTTGNDARSLSALYGPQRKRFVGGFDGEWDM